MIRSVLSRRKLLSNAAAGVAAAAAHSLSGGPLRGASATTRVGSMARHRSRLPEWRRASTPAQKRDTMLALFDRALKQKPDLVCFPEMFTGAKAAAAETVPGPTTDAFAQRAKAHRCYVICPIRRIGEGKHWNSAVVLDRSGQILGIYDKVHPVTTSPDYTVFEDGIFPGGEPPVFDLDFGRIGIQICFDAGFPETWEVLARKGVKAVFWSSAYHGGFALQTYAYLHHYYVITSVHTDESRVIDPCGRVVAETAPVHKFRHPRSESGFRGSPL